MKDFEIQYNDRFYEEKIYQKEKISAHSEKEALVKFANIFGINDHQLLLKPLYMWENGNWMSSFKCINEIIKK